MVLLADVNWSAVGALGNWAAAAGSFAAAIAAVGIALWEQYLKRLFIKPKIEAAACLCAPLFQDTPVGNQGGFILRFRVTNIGNQDAADVKVYCHNASHTDQSLVIERFVPAHLTWTNIEEATFDYIPERGGSALCNVATFVPKRTEDTLVPYNQMTLAGEKSPSNRGHIFLAGQYSFELAISSRSGVLFRGCLRVAFDDRE